MSNNVQPDKATNILPLQSTDRHPEWCNRPSHGCDHSHSSATISRRSEDQFTSSDRPEFSWNLSAAELTDGSRGMHVAGSMFFNNDLGMDSCAGLRCTVDDAEQFALDLLKLVALIHQSEPQPSKVTNLADYLAAHGGAR